MRLGVRGFFSSGSFQSLFVDRFHLLDQRSVGRGAGEVGDFLGVLLVIVEFHAEAALAPFGVTVAFGADGTAEGAGIGFHTGQARSNLCGAKGCLPDGRLGIGQHGREAFALEVLGLGQVAEVGEGGVQVDELGEGGTGLACLLYTSPSPRD